MSSPGPSHESSLLLTLEEISQLVSNSHDPHETLENIVRLIQGRFHTDVCSVYLLEPDQGELVLGATVGLRREGVGRVRMRLNEGLTGLVVEERAPVMVRDAFLHPRFKYFPEAGEDRYHSFLGVPLVEGGMIQGVLVVQTVEPRSFSPNEMRMLVTVGSQLAPLVSGATLVERIVAAAHEGTEEACPREDEESSLLKGAPLSPGTGLGEAYLVSGLEEWLRKVPLQSADGAAEARRLLHAMEAARAEIGHLGQRISALVGEDHGGILQAQLQLLQDRTIEQDLAVCLMAGSSAEGALLHTLEKYVAAFQKLSTPFFRERVYDVKDVFRRILWYLRPHLAVEGGGRVVLVAQEASVMDLFCVERERLAAVVVERGGPQSHAAILARSLGIPMVGQLPDLARHLAPGRQLLVDGTEGTVRLDPAPKEAAPALAGPTAAPPEPLPEEAFTFGQPRVEANINLLWEVPRALEQRAAGVGLYRSEFVFLARRTLPTEDEQVATYRKLLDLLGGRPAGIRTFDLRPDKLAPGEQLRSAGGGLDWRRVLDWPPLQKLFKEQVRAILRAAVAGPARILVPLVTRSELLDFVLQTVEEARNELTREGLEFRDGVPLGVTLETAAALALADTWARNVDFFALGTNDLMASALGIDRDDPGGAGPGDLLHPGLLRLIGGLVETAHQAGRPVTVCGEMAGDRLGALALDALGVDSLSVPVERLVAVRQALADRSPESAATLRSDLPWLQTSDQVRDLFGTAPTHRETAQALCEPSSSSRLAKS